MRKMMHVLILMRRIGSIVIVPFGCPVPQQYLLKNTFSPTN
jgi:hypothetical protein